VPRELLDVVHQTEALSLPVDFRAPAQREPIEPLVVPQVPDTGSTVAKLWPKCACPSGESMRVFICVE